MPNFIKIRSVVSRGHTDRPPFVTLSFYEEVNPEHQAWTWSRV